MSGPSPILTKTYDAGSGGVTKRRLVKVGAADGQVIHAVNATAPIIGVAADLDAAAGARVDTHQGGIAEVEFGGNVTRGNPVTADSDGKAVDGTPSAGATSWVLGIALNTQAAGDIGPVLISPHRMTTET